MAKGQPAGQILRMNLLRIVDLINWPYKEVSYVIPGLQ